jgi:hypothetical protein
MTSKLMKIALMVLACAGLSSNHAMAGGRGENWNVAQWRDSPIYNWHEAEVSRRLA